MVGCLSVKSTTNIKSLSIFVPPLPESSLLSTVWFVVEVGHVCNYFTGAAALICSLIVFMKRVIWHAQLPPLPARQSRRIHTELY